MRIGSLRLRVTVVMVAITTVMTALSIWLVYRTADAALRQQTKDSLEDNAAIYQTLASFGAGHPRWSQADAVVTRLAHTYGVRIALTDLRGKVLVDSAALAGSPAQPLPDSAVARVDPRTPTVSSLSVPASVDGADVRAATACLDQRRVPYALVKVGGLRVPQIATQLTADQRELYLGCVAGIDPYQGGDEPLPEARVIARCLHQHGFSARRQRGVVTTAENSRRAQRQLNRCYREALQRNTAPSALLYLGSRPELAGPFEGPALRRTLSMVVAIVGLAFVLAWWLGRRLTRPLESLVGAAAQLQQGEWQTRVVENGHDEVGQLSRAMNALAGSLQLNEALRQQLVSDVAHELGNPVLTLSGTLEAIEDGLYSPTPAVIASLSEEVDHLSRLVGDLGTLARVDGSALTLAHDVVDLLGLCESVQRGAQVRAQMAAVRLEVTGEPVFVTGDPGRLRQVLGNLVGNALRHTPQGGCVTMRCRRTDEGAALDVIDTGCGIAADQLELVFERFWRADPSRDAATGGSGLGLAIARELAQAHGGTLSVTSELGVGTTFTLSLPLEMPAGEPDQLSRATAAATRSSVAVKATRTWRRPAAP